MQDLSTTDLANYDGSYSYGSGPKGEFRDQTTPVGSFNVANAFGLYDMHGNVWEWCLDYWHDSYHNAPSDGRAWVTGGDDSLRVLRGSSWDLEPTPCRSANRHKLEPDSIEWVRGLRVVCAEARTPT